MGIIGVVRLDVPFSFFCGQGVTMSEETKDAGQEPAQQPETVSIEKLMSELENVKKAQQGSDRKVQELNALLKQKDAEIAEAKKAAETANMDKVDVLSNQLKEINEKWEAADRKAAHEKFIATGYKKATELGVSTSLVDHYGGKPEGLEDFLKGVKEEWEAKEAKIKNEMLASGYKPSAGSGDAPGEAWDPKKHSEAENLKHYEQETEAYYKGVESQA
jgi:hypothetical protein